MSPAVTRIVKLAGGPKAWKGSVRTTSEVIGKLRSGLPYAVLAAVAQDFQLGVKEIVEVLGIPWSTMARRKKAGRFRRDESDRLYRLVRIAAMAAEVLESRERTARWLHEPNRALGGETPLHLLDTDVGARQVEEILGRIEYGVYS